MPSEANGQKNETPEALIEDLAMQRKDSRAPDEMCCPLCGGPVECTWSKVPMINVAMFFIFLFVAPCVLFASGPGSRAVLATLSFVCAGIALLSLWALPVTAAIAAVAQPRCRACGHLCLPRSDEVDATGPARFPVRFALIGNAVLLAVLAVGLARFTSAPGQETGAVGLTFLLRVVMAGLALGLGVLAQTLVWRRWRSQMTSVVRRSLLLLPAVVLSVSWLTLTGYDHWTLSRKYEPVKRAPVVLNRAGLAPLPAAARDVKVHAWAFMLSGKYTLRFAADPNVIESFLAASPSLEKVRPSTYSNQRMRLRGGEYVGSRDKYDAQGNERFAPERDVPRWYRQEIRGPGRRYEINWYEGKYRGELLVDDEEHTVYVHVDRY